MLSWEIVMKRLLKLCLEWWFWIMRCCFEIVDFYNVFEWWLFWACDEKLVEWCFWTLFISLLWNDHEHVAGGDRGLTGWEDGQGQVTQATLVSCLQLTVGWRYPQIRAAWIACGTTIVGQFELFSSTYRFKPCKEPRKKQWHQIVWVMQLVLVNKFWLINL